MAGLLIVAVLWGAVEGCSYLAYGLIFKEPYAAGAVLARQDGVTGSDADNLTAAGKSDCVIHPYYGYAHNDNSRDAPPARYEPDSAAELGFYATRSLTPFDREAKYFVAVTGGSVAHLFAAHGREVLLGYVARLPQAQGRDIEFFDLSNWGYKQPQQLLIVSDLLHRGARFDLVINIDGYNELALSVANAQSGVSPFFPTQWDTATNAMPSKAAMEAYGQASLLQRWREACALRFRAWPHDPFLGLAWRLLDVALGQKIVALRTQAGSDRQPLPGDAIRLSANGKISLGPNREVDPAGFGEQAAAAWARASALLADLVRAGGGHYVHVLQPNQYVAGSKALTPQERRVAYLADTPNRPLVEKGYPLLRQAGEALRDSGVSFLDLSMVFADVEESLYEDTCCHFNAKGNALLGHAIGRALPGASPAGPGLSLARLEGRLRELGLLDQARLAREATWEADLLQAASPTELAHTGLGDIEGDADANWRWGLGPATEIVFSLPTALPVALRYALASPFAGQAVTVVFNGREIDAQADIAGTGQLIAPPASLEREMVLPGRAGRNVLELRYRFANGGEKTLSPGETRALAVIFRQLRLAVAPPARERPAASPPAPAS